MNNKISRSLMIAALTLSFTEISDVAFAGPLEDSMAAYDRGDYATAVRLVRPLAEQGNAQAQNSLGAMYYNGKGVVKDFKEAVRWYRLAAAQGNISAQLNLASMYYEGEGVVENFVRAHMWLNIVAASGLPCAAASPALTASRRDSTRGSRTTGGSGATQTSVGSRSRTRRGLSHGRSGATTSERHKSAATVR